MQTSKGFLIYAHNNEQIDYGKLALMCSLMIKRHLKHNAVCLVTDEATLNKLKENTDEALFKFAFDHIVMDARDFDKGSMKKNFMDSASSKTTLMWHNGTRSSAYDLSPFDETVLLDSDVLVQDNWLDTVWGNDEDVMINNKAITLEHKSPRDHEVRLDALSIKMYWATIVYFRKSEYAKTLFDLVSHVKSQYDYYQQMYGFPGKLFRNDYAFSIALHMMNGFVQNDEIKNLPQDTILSSFDVDELIEVRDGELVFLVHSSTTANKYTLNNVKKLTVHAMNKYALLRHADTIIDIYQPK